MATGKFITLEGVEGVGKTTNLEFLCDLLAEQGIPFETTREPGGTPLAEAIRELVLSPREETVDGLCELLLVFAARAQHLAQKIKPILATGTWVVSDRFTDATFAYQGAGRGLDKQAILQLETLVQGQLQPDFTLYLDCPPEIGLARAKQRDSLDRIEQESIAFFNRVRDGYFERAKQHPKRFAIVDASTTLDQVQKQIRLVCHERLGFA